MVRVTSARPSGGRPAVPAKMTSSILPPRRLFAPCSPRTQAMASTTLDLPDPLGPTTAVIPGSSRSVVADAKDLKPFSVRLDRCTATEAYARERLPSGERRAGEAGGAAELRESGLGLILGQSHQFVGEGRLVGGFLKVIALGAHLRQFLLEPAYSHTECGVLLDQKLCRGDDVTVQGLGHDVSGLSTAGGEPAPREDGSARAVVFPG